MQGQLDAARDEVRRLRDELLKQILERDRLLFVESWRLRYRYMRLFAADECAAYDLHTKIICRSLRRQLLADGLDSHAAEDIVAKKADERHSIWLANMQKRNRVVDNAYGWCVGDEQLRQLDFYYSQCVRVLHPDLFPLANSAQRYRMAAVTRAYAYHDLQVLAAMLEALQLTDLPRYPLMSMGEEELAAEKQRLCACRAANERMLAQMSEAEPFCYRDLLADPAACDAKKQQLAELLCYLREQLTEDDLTT